MSLLNFPSALLRGPNGKLLKHPCMSNTYFQFKQFIVQQDRCAMKVTTDACLFGAWTAYQCREVLSKHLVLDIGTGTGLLSLMFSQKIESIIDALEIDHQAFEQAKQNFDTSPWKNNIHPILDDVRQMGFEKLYDIIISNPPFYENDLRSPSHSKNKAHHDESLLLSDLLQVIKKNLHTYGKFFLLLPYRRNYEIENFFKQSALQLKSKVLVRPTTRHEPFRIMLEGIHEGEINEDASTGEIVIKDEHNRYTTAFTELLKDYYLHL